MSCRYRLYPTSVQSEGLSGHCADARYVWNLALEQANYWRRGGGSTPNAAQRQRQLAEARGCSWLGDGSSSVQQQALRDFDQALRNWWGGSHRRPRWRRRGISEGFVVRDIKVRVLSRKWATLNVPKLGAVRFRLSRPMPDEHGMARVTLDRAGRWHVSFSAPQPPVERMPTGRSVGVDLGVVATVATSDGERHHAPGLGQCERRRLKLMQRRMSRQREGSNRRARTKHAIAVLRALGDGPSQGLDGEGQYPAGPRIRPDRIRGPKGQGHDAVGVGDCREAGAERRAEAWAESQHRGAGLVAARAADGAEGSRVRCPMRQGSGRLLVANLRRVRCRGRGLSQVAVRVPMCRVRAHRERRCERSTSCTRPRASGVDVAA